MNEPDPIPRRSFLDPRERLNAEGAPFEDAVHIPCSELPGRTHELPARDELVRVVGPPALRQATIEWLRAHGRRAAAADAPFASGPAAAVTAPFAAAPGARAPGRLWAPNALLREVAPQLDPGAALDLACGVGRETVFLAASGWRVVAVDRLEDALQRGRALAATYGLGARIEWVALDLETATPREGGPLSGGFDLVTVFRFLHRPLLPWIQARLRPGGSLLYETFTTTHRARHGKPRRAALTLAPGELRALCAGLEIRHYDEAWRGDAHTARLWATRP